MEINASNVAQHKFFWGEAKYWMKKKKIGDLSTEEIQEITDNAIPVSTKSCKISKMNIKILRIHEDYVTT